MGKPSTYIKLDRNILRWHWYRDGNTKAVFIHLLLKAAIKDTTVKGVEVHRGQVAATYDTLAEELSMTKKQLRTAVEHLKTTGEIKVSFDPKEPVPVITVLKYEVYQDKKPENGGHVYGHVSGHVSGQVSGHVSDKAQSRMNTGDSRFDESGGGHVSGHVYGHVSGHVSGHTTLLKNNKRIYKELRKDVETISRAREEILSGAYEPKEWERKIDSRFWGRFQSENEFRKWWDGEDE